MSAQTKLVLSCIGVFIGGSVMQWQTHAKADPMDATFWVGIIFSGLAPLGAYFVGLAQRAPWEAPTLPTSVVKTEVVTTDPPPATLGKKPGG